jgi:N-carbamoyl-L-amino-acid hydrolase
VNRSLRIDPDRLWAHLMAMAEVGATPAGGSNRQALSDEDAAGRDLFVRWAEEAGCSLSLDAVGNLFARREGIEPDMAPILLGSHLDTQPTGGRFDGVYGVLAGLEVIETLQDRSVRTTAPIEVAVWTNEEGSRFPVSMMGSAVWAGALGLEEARNLVDVDGISVGSELDRLGWVGDRALGRPLSGYLELHIEQGPILERSGSDIGVVTGVQGFRWFTVELTGFPAHAGPTPMDDRRDPVRPLAGILDGLYRIVADHGPWARATPAQFNSEPISPNTVPARIRFSVDLRHPEATVLDAMDVEFRRLVAGAADAHGCGWAVSVDNDSPPVTFDDLCVEAVTAAAGRSGHSHERIVSGAGHDACYLAGRVPTAMVFVPCRDGLSHNESESIQPAQAAAGADVLLGATLDLAGGLDDGD